MPRHNRKRNRMRNFDYSSNNLYFVTGCVQDKKHFFGGIHNNTMCVNRVGSIVWRQWEWLITQYPYIQSHAFIVMPNHIHGVLEIDSGLIQNDDDACRDDDILHDGGISRNGDISRDGNNDGDRSRPVPTGVAHITGIANPTNVVNTQPIKIKPLSELIGAFKTTSSKQIHKIGFPQFAWQRSFHDHIIRNERAYQNIINYTIHNPQLWDRDRNNIWK